ncbi:Exodeoxyribonuclease X [Yersinia phage fHe-Yen9-04]|uniref:Exodeoxyribonuclease X n=2 Tax=Eneladusvirus Yen904 TaxID=2560849 RepID=A0A2C9CXK1_9CAUD|nr:DNA polymerase exonuclease subunit [Yersinia phage fHe-Yen9-04]SOK58550.1 Exodeoxyribonuclease X [Yersinia phage fHe-Yen9-04]SOK59086.1 Exodeoxyribonuclease X [Yersinia phage fHe-Yen9-03]VUE36319.1 Exodeoxyribonuclease X [Yersinia phage fHe-Yen9-04]
MTELDKFFNNVMVLDTETTGVDDESDIIEFSSSFPEGSNDSFDGMMNFTTRFKPTHDVPPDASAVHFITTEDLINEQTYSVGHYDFYPLFKLKQYFVGHNVQFDRRMLRKNHERMFDDEFPEFEDDNSWICTLKLAKKLFAEDPEFKNLTLSYLWFKFELYKTCTRKIVPHSAEDDVYMCYKVLSHLVNIAIERGLVDTNKEIGRQLVKLCNTPTLFTVMTIGKHKGMLLDEVPMNYLKWMILNMDIVNPDMPNYDADLAYTVEVEITRRIDAGLVDFS